MKLRCLSFSFLIALTAASVAAAERPNILFISVDDMSCDSVGVFGCPLQDTTPNIDQLASEGMRFEYAHISQSPSTPASLAAGLPCAGERICVLGFPDILFPPCDAFGQLLRHLAAARADVVLGLFPTRQPTSSDMVRTDAQAPGLIKKLGKLATDAPSSMVRAS